MRISDWSSDVCSSDLANAGYPAVELVTVELLLGGEGTAHHVLVEVAGVEGNEVGPDLVQAGGRLAHVFSPSVDVRAARSSRTARLAVSPASAASFEEIPIRLLGAFRTQRV